MSSSAGAPKNYEELFELYSERVRKLTYAASMRGGLRPHQAEDVASIMFLKFIEKDVISWFDPAKGKFEHLITRFVSLHSRGVIEMVQTKNNREVLHGDDTTIDRPSEHTPHGDRTAEVIDVFDPGTEYRERQLLTSMNKLLDLDFPVTILNLSVVTGWERDEVKMVWGKVRSVMSTVTGRAA